MKLSLFKISTKIIFLTTFAVLPFALVQTQMARSVQAQTVKTTPTPKKNKSEVKPTLQPVPPVAEEEPPLPTPTPRPKLVQTPPETLVGNQMSQVRFRNLTLKLPTEMLSQLPVYEEKPVHLRSLADFERKTNGNTIWTDDLAFYEVLNPRQESLLKVEVVTSLYNTDFAKAAIDEKPAGAAAEKLLEFDYLEETKAKESPGSIVKQVKYLKLNQLKPGGGLGRGTDSVPVELGVEGVYRLNDDAADKNRFILTWNTYRLFDGKARKVKIIISGKKTELPIAEEILASAIFEKFSRTAAPSETFKTESINRFGFGTLSIPSNMTAEPVKEDKKQNGDVEWTTYDYVWKTPAARNNTPPSLQARISTTVYNGDFKKVVVDIPLERRTPEFLLMMEHMGDLSVNKQFGDNRVKEARMMKLESVDGAYVLFRNTLEDVRFVAVWQTYRLLDNKVQRIFLTIEGEPGEISKAEQIIKSFKLAAQ